MGSQTHIVRSSQLTRRNAVHRARSQGYSDCFSDLHQQLEPSLQRDMDLAAVRGASSWLTTLPLNEHGFALHKSAFQDALALRYGWPPLRSPLLCTCGVTFSVEHVLSCPKGPYPLFLWMCVFLTPLPLPIVPPLCPPPLKNMRILSAVHMDNAFVRLNTLHLHQLFCQLLEGLLMRLVFSKSAWLAFCPPSGVMSTQ